MPPKPKSLSNAQIEALLTRDSDSEDDLDEIFGPGVELDDEAKDLPSTSGGAQSLPSTSAGAQALPSTSGDANFEDYPDNYDNHVESK